MIRFSVLEKITFCLVWLPNRVKTWLWELRAEGQSTAAVSLPCHAAPQRGGNVVRNAGKKVSARIREGVSLTFHLGSAQIHRYSCRPVIYSFSWVRGLCCWSCLPLLPSKSKLGGVCGVGRWIHLQMLILAVREGKGLALHKKREVALHAVRLIRGAGTV